MPRGLLELYHQFKDRENFIVVCLSIDPEQDGLEHLEAMQKQLEVDGSNWWFLKCGVDQRDEWHRYMR